MNKRQIKKKKNAYKRNVEKIKSVLTVDLTNATPGSKIDIYVSKLFETDVLKEGESGFKNDIQNRYISSEKVIKKGFTHAVFVKNGGGNPFYFTIWLSDTNKSYYVIRPKKEEVAV